MAKTAVAQVQTSSSDSTIGYIILVLGGVLAIGGCYLVYKQFYPSMLGATPAASTGDGSSTTPPASTSPTYTPKPPVTYSEFPLRSGSTGQKVKDVQHYENTRYGSGLVEDGIWGSKTQAAVNKNDGISSVSQDQYNTFMGWTPPAAGYGVTTSGDIPNDQGAPGTPSTFSYNPGGYGGPVEGPVNSNSNIQAPGFIKKAEATLAEILPFLGL